jgi:hypothetical protein
MPPKPTGALAQSEDPAQLLRGDVDGAQRARRVAAQSVNG